jgi:asparagine synthase (glutamine-hydrolysing)
MMAADTKTDAPPARRFGPGEWLARLGDPPPQQPGENGHNGASTFPHRLHLVASGAFRPASAENSSIRVIFDGTLFNRADLEAQCTVGVSSATDAELVLRVYQRYGEEALARLKGDFVLALWDREREMLWAVRDPSGLRPLFYATSGDEIYLSSSILALVHQPRVGREVNRLALADHLAHRWPDWEETYFRAVRRVPPGHALRASRAERTVHRVWPLVPSTGIDWVGPDELGRFDELFEQAVSRCLGQGPAGIYLSGGLDSVSVAAVAVDLCRRQGRPIPQALSLGFPPPANEEPIQKQVAHDLGISQVLMPMVEAVAPRGLIASALEVSARRPAPLLNLWAPAYHRLGLEGKARGCQVILTGNGGDEWLEVSPMYAADLLRQGNLLGLYRFWSSMCRSWGTSPLTLARVIFWKFGARPLLGRLARTLLGGPEGWIMPRLWRRNAKRWIPAWVAPGADLREQLYWRSQQNTRRTLALWEQGRELSPRHGFYLGELLRLLTNGDLVTELEEFVETGREMGMPLLHPYWDAELVRFLYRIPPEVLYAGGRSKALVRQMLARRFPRLGFERQRKLGAAQYFREVLVAEGRLAWERLGKTSMLADLGIVDRRAMNHQMADLFQGNRPTDAHHIWFALSLEAWLRGQR